MRHKIFVKFFLLVATPCCLSLLPLRPFSESLVGPSNLFMSNGLVLMLKASVSLDLVVLALCSCLSLYLLGACLLDLPAWPDRWLQCNM